MANDENKNNTNIWTINLSSPLEMSARILGKYSRHQLREIVNCIRVELEFYLYRPIWYPNAKALEDKNGNPASLSCHLTYTKKKTAPKKIILTQEDMHRRSTQFQASKSRGESYFLFFNTVLRSYILIF